MKVVKILAVIFFASLAVGIVKFVPFEQLFKDHLSDARAFVAVNDIDEAIKSYKLSVMDNPEDPVIRREYINFMREQVIQEEWLELEKIFIASFPTSENFKAYDSLISKLLLEINNEGARILSEDDIEGFKAKRREQQEFLNFIVHFCQL